MHEGDSFMTQGLWKDGEPGPITRGRLGVGPLRVVGSLHAS